MTIGLVGYGKMGKEVEAAARERHLTIGHIFTEEENPRGSALTSEALRGIDVCIDFSSPAAVLDNIRAVAAARCNMVVGTTGWQDRLESVRELVLRAEIGFLYSANFSLGMNLFFEIVSDAARLLGRYPEYDAAITEVHHSGKADSPSGTALHLGSLLLQALQRKTGILAEPAHGPIAPHQLHISSTRTGRVPGTHRVLFDSDADTIELTHTARNRRGFALGALVAAEWLKGKKGFYTMRDVILS
jgi:4-hydroxy-tetrahydrodipicolinate reductase